MDAFNHFADYLRDKGLQQTRQREDILLALIKSNRHVDVQELYEAARKRNQSVGKVTVFRTLKLLCEAGLVAEVDLGGSAVKYEFIHGRAHHDHLVCVTCGKFIETMDPEIEQLQERLCRKMNFEPLRHRMEIYGVCANCQKARA